MKYFIDSEFNQTIDPIQLMSIAIVAEDGRELYMVSGEFNQFALDDWLRINVLPKLFNYPSLSTIDDDIMVYPRSLKAIKENIERFIGDDQAPEFWGYYAAYDWYLLTRFWGFENMPKNFPIICYDLKQLQVELGVTKLPDPFQPAHHALVDARWNKTVYDYLRGKPQL